MAANDNDDVFTARLAEYDAALADGTPHADETPEDAELRQAKSCLEQLEAIWPRHQRIVPATRMPSETLTEPPVQPQLGRFRIVREVGRGGGGIVYLAYDPTLHRQVAVKVPRPEFLFTPDLRRRFVREAEVAAQLNHRNIIPVHEAGQAGGVCYLVSAYCSGPNLMTWLRGRNVPPRQAALVVAALADGVAHMHGRGILHRDIKPTNVLLEFDDQGNAASELGFVPRLTDFGLAKLDVPLPRAEEVTHTGAVIGTPAYMAPEQAEGRLDHIGAATDVYALGVVLYELLAGQVPFRGNNDVATLQRVAIAEPTPLRRLRREAPRDLEAICLKCLEKAPSRRYQSAAALAEDLQRYLEGRPTQARPSGALIRAGKWIRRKPGAAALVGIAALCLLALVAIPAWIAMRDRENDLTLDAARKQTDFHKSHAQERDWSARNQFYAAQMRRAWEAYEEGHLAVMRDVLNALRPEKGDKDVRGFEWHYLRRLSRQDLVLRGHRSTISSLAYSDDGRLCAAGAADGTIKIWDVDTGQLKMTLEGHQRWVRALRFAAQDTRLFSGAWNQREGETENVAELRVWDLATKQCILERGPYRHKSEVGIVLGIAFARHASSAIVIRTGDKGSIVGVDLETGQEKVLDSRELLADADVSPDGKLIAIAERLSAVRILEPASTRPTRSTEPELDANVVKFSEDGESLAIAFFGSRGFAYQIRDVASLKLRAELPIKLLAGPCLFDPSGKWLAATDYDNHGPRGFSLFNLATGVLVDSRQDGSIQAMAFSPQGEELAVGGRDHLIHMRAIEPAGEGYALPGPLPKSEAWCLAFLRDGTLVAGYDHENESEPETLELWNLHTRKVKNLKGHRSTVMALAASADRRTLATASHDKTVRLWDVASGKCLEEFADHTGPVRAVAIHPDGTLVASAGSDRTLVLHDRTAGKKLAVPNAHRDTIRALTFAANGRLLISAGNDKQIHIWRRADLSLVRSHIDEGKVQSVACSPAAPLLASGNERNQVKIWNLESGDLVRKFQGHTGKVRAVAFSPQGKTLASGGEDKVVRVWNVLTGQEMLALPTDDYINGLAFDPAGKTLAAALHDGKVKVWPAH